MGDIINCAKGKHKRVYGDIIHSVNPMAIPWICEICGSEGWERARVPDSRYQQLKAKYNHERMLRG